MRYHLKERFLTIKDDFVVRNDRDEIVFDVKGSFFRIGDYLRIYNRATGEEVFSMKEKLFTRHKDFTFYQNGAEVATMRKKDYPDFANNFFEVACATGVVLQLRGNYQEWDFEIVDQYKKCLYGHIGREFAIFSDHYAVDVPDGIDPLFIIAIAVVLDEMREDGIKTE